MLTVHRPALARMPHMHAATGRCSRNRQAPTCTPPQPSSQLRHASAEEPSHPGRQHTLADHACRADDDVQVEKKLSEGVEALNALQEPLCGDRGREPPILHRGFNPPAPVGAPHRGVGPPAAGSAEGFREDSLDALLQMCGFQEVPQEFIEEADEEEGKKGLNVHVPPAKELPTRVYFRGLAEKEVRSRYGAS